VETGKLATLNIIRKKYSGFNRCPEGIQKINSHVNGIYESSSK
jgi:hypothetical protein